MNDWRSGVLPRLTAGLRSPLFWSVVALWLLLLAMEHARPRYFLHDDNASWFLPAFVHDFRVLSETGRVAEVNYFQHGGEPFLQQGQTAVLYPPVYLGVALAKIFSGDVIWSIEWIAAINLTLGLTGFYFWLRQGGVTAGLAALGALVWAFNPFVLLVSASWIFTTFVAAWLPWVFWSLDLSLARPSSRTALFLGVSTSLLFLQGYVQWFAYAILLLVPYAILQIVLRPEARKPIVFYYLFISVLIFAALTLPLLLPMLHAVGESAMRAEPLPVEAALFYCLEPGDIIGAQFCHFQSTLAFNMSIAALYCPALLILPVTALRLCFGGATVRRRLIPLLVVGLLALFFSTRGHELLTLLPLFNKFRWPFKVFLLADFFIIATLVWTVASWTGSRFISARIANLTASIGLAVVALSNLWISLSYHDQDVLSPITFSSSVDPLPPGLDPQLGRIVSFGDHESDAQALCFFTHTYATYFAFPSLGGYNPLVGEKQLEYSLYLDFPNFCTGTMTPAFQKDFQARSVRYWIVDVHSSQLREMETLPSLKQIAQDENRIFFEDTQAAPLVYAIDHPDTSCAFSYSGNSLLVPLSGITSPVSVSVAPTDGWWYRLDRGPWLRPPYAGDRLTIEHGAAARLLEISYFDRRFREGLFYAALLVGLLAMIVTGAAAFTTRSRE